MSQAKSGAVLRTERVIAATPGEIFQAIEKSEVLAKWWGPRGFTNTVEKFEFRVGGNWEFVMHGPDGANYPNHVVFRVLDRDRKVVFEHVDQPHFTLTLTLTARGEKTHLEWVQEFDTAEMAEKLRAMCEPANEQNLDRLEGVLGKR